MDLQGWIRFPTPEPLSGGVSSVGRASGCGPEGHRVGTDTSPHLEDLIIPSGSSVG